jgi:uncharacterized membrane protein/Mg-chelatase subunit ChlD
VNLIALQLPFSFDHPRWLWLALLVPVIIAVSWRPLASLGPVRRAAAVGIRSIVILAIVATLAEIHHVRRNDDLTVMFLMDRSISARAHTDAQESYMETVCKKIKPDDRVGVIDFAKLAFLEQLPMKGGYFLERGRLPEMSNPDRTDVAAAIRLSMAMFPHDTAKRIVLMSDGNDNMSDALEEARRAAADNIVIDVVPLWYATQREIYFDKMVAPSSAEVGEIVPIRMNVKSNTSGSGRIDIYHNDVKLDLPLEMASKRIKPGNNSFVLKLPIESAGTQRFEARFVPDDASVDTTPDNNRATSFTFVSGKGSVAIMTMHPEQDQALLDALLAENVKASMVPITDSVPDLAGLLDYSAIILSNVPANVFTDEQQKLLASYVEDMGGGLIMTGGDESFGAGGWIGTPVADILPVELEIKHKKIIPRGALVLILHSCELPRGNFWGKLVAKKSVDTISSQDFIGVIAYAAGESWEVPLGLATNKALVKKRIDRAVIGDMPDFDASLRLALKGLRGTDAAQKHVILISDGDATPPTARLLKNLKASKITVSTIAIGYGVHVQEATLRKIARITKGRFYPVRNPKALPQIFVKESKVVRRPLIVDEPFTPHIQFASSDLLAGVTGADKLPPLGGFVLTSPRPALALVPVVRVSKDGRDPVLAHWQRGLGRVVAFTSGYWPKWGTNWTQWSKFSKLWAQITRWTMRQEAPANFDSYTIVEGNQARIIVEALDKNADYLNFLNLRSKVIHPTKGAIPIQFTQTGPGHYEAVFDTDATGQYIANIAVFQEGEYQGSMHTGVSMPFSPELREVATNEALLREIADVTGGRFLDMQPETDDVFAHDLPPTVSQQPVWDWTLAWLLLPLFFLDVATRRLASWLALSIVVEIVIIVVLLFGVGIIYTHWWGVLGTLLLAELVGWTIRFSSIRPMFEWMTHTVTVLGTAGQRSTASLDQLKAARDRDRETDKPSKKIIPKPIDAPPAPSKKTRFDAGEPAEGTAAGNLSDALGGAKSAADSPAKQKPKTPDDSDQTSDEATTSRLLRAKRRARRDTDDTNAGPGDAS